MSSAMMPAMKKIVEAMRDEFSRQVRDCTPARVHERGYSPHEPLDELAGGFDLEKVARAALLAAREPTAEMLASGAVDYAATSSTKRVWRGMVDVLLTGRPSSLDTTRDPSP